MSCEIIKLADILDNGIVPSLLDILYSITRIPVSIIDIHDKILVSAGWENICSKYHNHLPTLCKNCFVNKTRLNTGRSDDRIILSKCFNGLNNLAVPIIIEGHHLGNLFMCQFLFVNDNLDFEFLRQQAELNGFKESHYIESIERLPRISAEELEKAKNLINIVAHSVSQLSTKNLKLTLLIEERTALKESLMESEERFRNIFEKPKAIMILIDPQTGNISNVNSAAAEFYGCSCEQLCSMRIHDILMLSEKDVDDKLLQALKGRDSFYNLPVKLSDDRIKWIDAYPSPIENQGKLMHFIVIHDVTERKYAEDQLHKLSGAIEQSPNSIIITDVNGNIEYANQRFTELSGYPIEEVIGSNPGIVKSGKTDLRTYKNLWETITKGEQWRGIIQNKKKSGEFYWESVNISPIINSEGLITHFTAVKGDITEQKKHEEMLYRLNRTLNALRHTGEAIILAENEASYLSNICRIIVEDCGHALIWIGFALNDEEKSVQPVAWAGLEEGYIESMKISWGDNDRGRGPTGIAVRTGRISHCNNMQSDPKFIPWRDQAIKRGYASSISLPLNENGKTFGAVTIYSSEIKGFSGDEIHLLKELADLLSYGISIIRLREVHSLAEIELQKHRENLEELVLMRTKELETANEILKEAQEVAHIGHWKIEHSNNRLIWSEEVYNIFGIKPDSLNVTFDMFLGFVHPGDREFVKSSFEKSVSGHSLYNLVHRIVRQDNEICFLHEKGITHYDSLG